MDDQKIDQLYAMRHSLAHIMATAIQHIWPEAKFGIGPVVQDGFYYDVDLEGIKLSAENFATLEKEMHKVIAADEPFEKIDMSIDQAIQWAQQNDQPYKLELLNDLKRAGTTVFKDLDATELGVETKQDSAVETVSFYRNGDFTDLCRGPHVASTGKVGAFKLIRVSGAYWRGDEHKPQMQRIYGVAFETEEELKKYLDNQEEAKKRDHRKLGYELDLFTFSDLVGAGLPLWTPNGTVLRRELDNYVQQMRDAYDYQEVTTPHINKKELFEKSGHWNKFSEELFKINTREGHLFAMKPMSCPMHAQIYAAAPRSYRDLPIRYRESAFVYRDEQSGELSGLSRVRSFTQDDAHVFCRKSQIKEEFLKIWDIVDRFYSTLNFPLSLRFSRHDPDAIDQYSGKEADWKSVEALLKEMIEEKVGTDYIDGLGEAAFYGPKLDFISHDALGREWQVATIQLDFNQPEGFDLTCMDENSQDERIFMIHAAIMGSIDRFVSVLIEHTAGKFPVWLAPEQVRLVTVNQETKTVEFAQEVANQAKDLNVRLTIDNTNESVGKKIRAAELKKVPYVVVIGEKEIESDQLLPRIRSDLAASQDHKASTVHDFLKTVADETKDRVARSSL